MNYRGIRFSLCLACDLRSILIKRISIGILPLLNPSGCPTHRTWALRTQRCLRLPFLVSTRAFSGERLNKGQNMELRGQRPKPANAIQRDFKVAGPRRGTASDRNSGGDEKETGTETERDGAAAPFTFVTASFAEQSHTNEVAV